METIYDFLPGLYDMRNVLAVAVLLTLALPAVGAVTTVTLTGSCIPQLINQTNNYLLFNLSNSGNGPASDVLLIPSFSGATTPNSSISIPIVPPSGAVLTRFYLYNFTNPGRYAEYITAKYSQSSSTFITIFSCLVGIGKSPPSLVQILSVNRTGSRVAVSLFNLAKYPINANVTLRAPATFTVQPQLVSLMISPNSQAIADFNISTPSYTNAEFPIVAATSYTNSSVHYAAMAVGTISFASTSGSPGIPLSTIVILAAVFVLLVLIIVSMLRSRGKKRGGMPETPAPVMPAPQ